MKTVPLLLGFCAAGLLTGLGATKLFPAATNPPEQGENVSGKSSKSSARGRSGTPSSKPGAGKVRAASSSLRSSDSLQDIIKLDDQVLYGRLALWLIDASPDDIAAYWNHHKARDTKKRDITDLVMIGWTRVDPQAAIAATKGTSDAEFPWWAWSSHDPKAALEAAIAVGSDRVNNVTWGIGEFHPKWLRENFDLLPKNARGNAIAGLVKWGEVDDAMATLEFLKERGSTPPKGMLKNLVKQDPWAAYDWFDKNGEALGSQYGGRDQAMNLLINALAEAHPDVLTSLIAEEPSGARKRSMEAAAFGNLLQLDPEAALRAATETNAPVVGAERMAAVGLHLARTDPDRAFEVAEELFERLPNSLGLTTRIVYPNGGSSSRGVSQGPSALLDTLIARDPARAMEMQERIAANRAEVPEQPATGGAVAGASVGGIIGNSFSSFSSGSYSSYSGGSPIDHIASRWAQQDVEGFAEWVVERNDSDVTNRSAPVIVNQLRGQHRFDEAAEWAMGMTTNRQAHLSNLIQSWNRSNPDQAREWLESADLPEQDRAHLQPLIQARP